MEQAAVSTPVSARLTPLALVRALRPDEWVKNSFVFAGLLFGGEFDATGALKAGGAFIAFCAVASAGYRDQSSCAITPIRKTDKTPSSAAAKRPAVKLSPLVANTPPRKYG
jgi:hypothetical protein